MADSSSVLFEIIYVKMITFISEVTTYSQKFKFPPEDVFSVTFYTSELTQRRGPETF